MPYGAPADLPDFVPAGPEQSLVPYTQLKIVNNWSSNTVEAIGLYLNAARTVNLVADSPIGIPYVHRITPTVVGGSLQNSVQGLGAQNELITASVYLRTGPGAGTGQAKFQHFRSGGTQSIDASATIDVATGQVLAVVQPEFSTVDIQTFVVNERTWLRINIRIDDRFANGNVRWAFFPDIVGTSFAQIQGILLAFPNPGSAKPPIDEFLRPAYTPDFGSLNRVQPAAIHRTGVDTRAMYVFNGTGGGITYPVRMPEWQGITLQPNSGQIPTITLPASISADFPLLEGYYFDIDLRLLSQSPTPICNVQSVGGSALRVTNGQSDATLINLFDLAAIGHHARANSVVWRCTHVGNGVWQISPVSVAHGAVLFTANGNFTTPQGARALYLTGSAGGGGGSPGGAAAGAGGASGQAIHKQLQVGGGAGNPAWGLNPVAITIGAGGAAALAGGNTTFGAFVTLLGGAPGIGAIGGVANAGGANGQAGIGAILGGAGGGNIAGGIGGVCFDPAAASTAGQRGGGGAGGAPGQAAGAGGNGYLLIEW